MSKMNFNYLTIIALAFVLTVFQSQTICAQVISDGLEAYYNMNDGLVDLSGNNREASLTRLNRHDDVTGEGIGSYRFNSKKDLMTIPVNLNNVATKSFTIATWVYFDALGKANGISNYKVTLFGNSDGAGNGLWVGLYQNADKEKGFWSVRGSRDIMPEVSQEKTLFRGWTHVAVVVNYETNRSDLYIDGKRLRMNVKIEPGRDFLYFNDYSGDNKRDEFAIDEMYVFNRSLSSSEISKLKNSIEVFDTREYRKELDKSNYYIVRVDSTRVKSAPNVDTEHHGFVYKGDTIRANQFVANEGRGYYKWLKVNYEGKIGYLIGANLIRHNDLEQMSLRKQIYDRFRASSKKQWITISIVLLLAFILTFGFGGVDKLLASFTDRKYKGGAAKLPLLSAMIGAFLGAMFVVFENKVGYLYSHFTWLPMGYGLVSWLVIISIGLLALGVLIMIISSFISNGPIHALLRILLVATLTTITFLGTFLVAMVAIYVAIAVAAILLFGNAALPREYKVTWSDGSVTTEYM